MKTFKEEDHFEVLRRIDKDPKASQRKLAEDLGFSLGKLNYCLKALQRKGLVTIQQGLQKILSNYHKIETNKEANK